MQKDTTNTFTSPRIMNNVKKLVHPATLIPLMLIAAAFIAFRQSNAHGAMAGPLSRSLHCFEDLRENHVPTSLACQWAMQISGSQQFYDWHEVNLLAGGNHRGLISDGELCSASRDKYFGLDIPADYWTATVIEDGTASIQMDFDASTPHSTDYFWFYLTKDGWDSSSPLKWTDLEDTPFCIDNNTQVDGDAHYRMDCSLPEKSGRHVIYTIWQRDDTPEAFYSCSDVFFEDAQNPAPVVEVPTIGQCNAHPWFSAIPYLSGDLVLHNDIEWQASGWNSGSEPGTNGSWVQVGTCDGSVTPVPTTAPTTEPTPEPTIEPTISPTPAPTVEPSPTPAPGSATLQVANTNVRSTEQVTVSLAAFDLDYLASATINVLYDPAVVSAASCSADPNNAFDLAICNVQSANNQISLSLVDGAYVSGDATLMDMVFTAVGSDGDVGALTISVATFADSGGQALSYALDNGSISIVDAQTGDVNCDNSTNTIDALFILQYSVASRAGGTSCPPAADELYLGTCDVNGDNSCDVVDALFVLQCTVGMNNVLCPAPQTLMSRLGDATSTAPSNLLLAVEPVGGAYEGLISAEIPASNPVSALALQFDYDASLLDATGCQVATGMTGVCNIDYDSNTIALSILSTGGLSGLADLATISFTPLGEGNAAVVLNATQLVGTNGNQIEANEASLNVTVAPSSVTAVQVATFDVLSASYLWIYLLLLPPFLLISIRLLQKRSR